MINIQNQRHSLAHALACAVLKLYPHALLTIGPATDNGFYYDIDFSLGNKPEENDFESINNEMRKIIKIWKGFEKQVVDTETAKNIFKNNKYKLELINDIVKRNEEITLYTSGKDTEYEFTDLCRGGHIDDMSSIDTKSFMIEKIAGAYFKGDANNTMLTRIYGLAFENKEELDKHIWRIEEAKKRDHRKLGKELKLFTISDYVGSGLPLFQPNGTILRQELEKYLWNLHKIHGYQRVWTPHLGKADLYKQSGHSQHYMDDMFSVKGGSSKEEFYVKPMNCPHHMQIFADNLFSYRDMPIRYFEPATVYRDEKTGQLSGLTRVRSITQDDGHLFCRINQVEDEVKIIVSIIKEFYTTMGFINDFWVRLSTRGEDKSVYLGNDEVWKVSEKALNDICISENLPFNIGEGEAAFYGPKLDFMFKDAIGREWQLATIQLDFNLPERFDLSFINEKGEKERPVVIHRAISGSIERFLGIAIEHFAGSFPIWLSPVQVKVIPIGERQFEYAKDLHNFLISNDIRSELDTSNDGFGKKVRNAKVLKTPYIIVLGDKEIESNLINLEGRKENYTHKVSGLDRQKLLNHLQEQILKKVLD